MFCFLSFFLSSYLQRRRTQQTLFSLWHHQHLSEIPSSNSARSVQPLIPALRGFSSLPARSLQHFGQPHMQHVLRSRTSKSSGEPPLQELELLAEVLRRVLHKLLLLRSTGLRCGATDCLLTGLGLRQRALSEKCQKLLPECFYNWIFEHRLCCVTGIRERLVLLDSASKLDIYKKNIW